MNSINNNHLPMGMYNDTGLAVRDYYFRHISHSVYCNIVNSVLEIDYLVVPPSPDEPESVATFPSTTLKDVVTSSTINFVAPDAPIDSVITFSAVQRIIPLIAVNSVILVAAIDVVVPSATDDCISI